MRAREAALALSLLAAGCRGSGQHPSPSSTAGPSPTSTGPTTTARSPTISAEPIAGLDAEAFHAALEKAGFSRGTPAGPPGFTTITSKRSDATVSSYGKGAQDVVKIVAEADRSAAAAVMATVIGSVLKGPDVKKADTWMMATLKKGPLSPSTPRTASARFANVPFELLVNQSTATLSIGRIIR